MSCRRYLVFSDIHLADIENHADGWKRYKSSTYMFDGEFDKIVQEFVTLSPPDAQLVLVLNGDIFDFDLVSAIPEDPPWPVSRAETKRCLDPTEAKSAWKLKRMIADHPALVATLAGFLARGHELVYIMGNHDREFHFAAVQQVFVSAITRWAIKLDAEVDAAQIRFEPWFYHVPGEVYVEHGQQYDYYSSFRHVLDPVATVDGTEQILLPMGSWANRRLITHMGFFNPHSTDFIRGLASYMAHWFKHYAFSRRSLFINWFFGSLWVLYQLLRTKERMRPPEDYDEKLQAQAKRNGLDGEALRKIADLQKAPITSHLFRVLREFWFDRVLIATLMIGGTVALALVDIPLWIQLMVPLTTFPLLYVLYELMFAGDGIEAEFQKVSKVSLEIAKLLNVQAIVFGHTHKPQLVPLAPHCAFVNSGTWAPMWQRGGGELLPGFRNYVVITSRDGKVRMQLESWTVPTGFTFHRAHPRSLRAATDAAGDRHTESAGQGGEPQRTGETAGDHAGDRSVAAFERLGGQNVGP